MRFSFLSRYLKPPRGFRLTKSGRFFFGFLFAIILIAMATGNNLLYIVLALLLAFMIVSGIESEMNLRHIRMDRLLPAEIYAGLPSSIGYVLCNDRNCSERLVIRDINSLKIKKIERHQTETLRTESTFQTRGRFELGPVVIATTFPYGLFEKSITFDIVQEIFVFPKPFAFQVSLSTGWSDTGSGRMKDSISHVRPYSPGDPLSSVVWKKQNQGLVSRVLEGGAGMRGVIVILPGGDPEQKLSKACYAVSELHRQYRPFGLVLNDYYSGIAFSREHKIRILEQLAIATEIQMPLFEAIPSDVQVIYIP